MIALAPAGPRSRIAPSSASSISMTTYLEDLKAELIEVQRVAVEEGGRVLVWTGDAGPAPRHRQPRHHPRSSLAYTPPYLAEKILTSRSALEGERKQVTVLFADLKGSMELLAERDPEEARQLLDPVLERMMAAVHRYEGTVNQVMGDGIMALFGAPIAHEDHAVRACYAALAMQDGDALATPTRCGAPTACRCRCASASMPGRWWCGRLATTCIWTTRRWARLPTWPRVWSRWPRRARSAHGGDPAAGRRVVQVTGAGPRPGQGADGPGGGL